MGQSREERNLNRLSLLDAEERLYEKARVTGAMDVTTSSMVMEIKIFKVQKH